MLNWRENYENNLENFKWVKPGVKAWVYNNNIIPGKKIFLDVEILEVDLVKQRSKLKTKVSNKINSEFYISIFKIYQKSNLNKEDYYSQDDISFLPIVNAPEIFNYLKFLELNQKSYFFTGLDFYFINIYEANSEFQRKQTLVQDQKEALKWLTDEKTLKPKKASITLFLSSILKSFFLTFQKQTIFIQGEIQSGKSSHVLRMLQFFCYYNQSREIQLSSISIKKNASKNSQILRQTLDKTLKQEDLKDKLQTIQTQEYFISSQIDFEKEHFEDTLEDEINKIEFYSTFNDKLVKAYKVIFPFVEVISGDNKRCSAGTKIFNFKMDENFKFVSFEIQIKFLLIEYLKGDRTYNFLIFYYIFRSLSKEEIQNYGFNISYENYDFLEENVEVKNPKVYLESLKQFLGLKDYQFVIRSMIIIAEIINLQQQKLNDQKIEFLENELNVSQGELGNILKEKQNFEQGKKILYQLLYQNLVTFILDKINLQTKKGEDLLAVYDCLQIIDSQGYCDLNRYNNYDDYNDNGYIQFIQNFYNEKIFHFFNDQRFNREKKIFEKENLIEYLEDVQFFDNKYIVQELKQFVDILQQSANIREFKKNLENKFDVFLKSTFSLLNQKIEHEEESLVYYVSLKHFFSSIVNYDLQDIFIKDTFNQNLELQIKEILQKSYLFSTIRFQESFAFQNSKILKFLKESEDFLNFDQNDNVYFFGTLKIINSEQDQDFNKYLYKQFDSIDFQSQILRYKKNYPYRIDYKYLIDKFNVMTQTIKINPHLIVDYKNIVSQILLKMFGENHQQKFLFGITQLFVKEEFFEEFDELIKELNQENSRLNLFVQKSMNEMLKEHLDNSDKIIRLCRFFLEKNCCLTKFEKWKLAFSKMIKNWRLKKAKRIANFIIQLCLDQIEYYNIKQVVKVQRHIRGFLSRLKNKRQITILKKNKFQRYLEKQTNLIQKQNSEIQVNYQKFQLQLKQKFLLQQLNRAVEISKLKIFQIQKDEKMRRTIYELIHRYRLLRLLEKTRAVKKAQLMIQRFFLVRKFRKNIKMKIKKKRHLKRAQKFKEQHDNYLKILNESLERNNFSKQQIKIFKPPSGKINNEKVEIYFQNLFLRLIEPNQKSECFIKDYFDIINKIIKTNDNILQIQSDDNVTQILTKKQNLYIMKYADKNIYQIKLNEKVQKIGFMENFIVYISEKNKIDYRNILFEKNKNGVMGNILNNSNHSPFLIEQIKNYNWQILDFQQKFNFFVLTTHCQKLLIKDFNTNHINQYQFKRKIRTFAIGENFVIALDQGGVLFGQGDNSRGQLGIGYKQRIEGIIVLEHLTKQKEIIKALSCGQMHTFIATQSGKIYCWGDNQYNQLGQIFDNNLDYQPRPQIYPSKYFPQKEKNVQIKCGQFSTYFLFPKKQLFALGTLDLNTTYLKPKKIDLTQIFSNDEIPVSLNVEFNSNFEFVYLKSLSSKNSKFYNFVYFQKFAGQIFKIFIKNNLALIPFQEQISKDLNLMNLSTKLVKIKNQDKLKAQEKEIKELFF